MTIMMALILRLTWMLLMITPICSGVFNIAYASKQETKLDLMDVLNSVNHHFPQIQIAHLDITKAGGAFVSAQGKFDPTIDTTAQSQPAGGYINNYGDAQLTIPTLYNGVKLFAGYRNGQGDWPIYYQNYLTNSGGEYRAGLSLPLLRDRLIDKDRTDLISTSESVLMKKQDAEAIKLKIYGDAIKAYWQWREAGLQLNIFHELLKLAQTRQNAIVQQANRGDLPQLTVTENQQQIVQRQQLLNQGQLIFEQAGIQLSLYYRDKNGQPLVPPLSRVPSLEEAISSNLNAKLELMDHPGIKSLSHYMNMMKYKRDLARNELLPQLDTIAYTFKQNGTGGYPELLEQGASIGLSFKFPLLQRQAKGNLIQAQSEMRQVKIQKKFLYDQLNNELSKMLVGVKRSVKQTKLLNKELSLAQTVQQGETKRFYQGDSTLFLVNQREQITTQVELNALHARIQLEELKARIRYFISSQ